MMQALVELPPGRGLTAAACTALGIARAGVYRERGSAPAKPGHRRHGPPGPVPTGR